MQEAAEWNDENTRIVCELYAEQVRLGNRPSTHLNNIGYNQVALKFQQRTQLLYSKRQFKNKWDKLKNEYGIWKKLLIRGSGLGWNSTKGTIAADENWWTKTITELPGAKKFRKAGMQNVDLLRVMFDDITNNGVDHMPLLAASLPSTPENPRNVDNLDQPEKDNDMEDNDDTQLEHVSPSNRNKKRPLHVNANKNKRNRTETALVMQAQLKGIVDLAEKAMSTFDNFTTLLGSLGSGIPHVMTCVQECGAHCGSDEHFIATELFVHKEQREMFLTLETAEERLEWLRRKYKAKYGA